MGDGCIASLGVEGCIASRLVPTVFFPQTKPVDLHGRGGLLAEGEWVPELGHLGLEQDGDELRLPSAALLGPAAEGSNAAEGSRETLVMGRHESSGSLPPTAEQRSASQAAAADADRSVERSSSSSSSLRSFGGSAALEHFARDGFVHDPTYLREMKMIDIWGDPSSSRRDAATNSQESSSRAPGDLVEAERAVLSTDQIDSPLAALAWAERKLLQDSSSSSSKSEEQKPAAPDEEVGSRAAIPLWLASFRWEGRDPAEGWIAGGLAGEAQVGGQDNDYSSPLRERGGGRELPLAIA